MIDIIMKYIEGFTKQKEERQAMTTDYNLIPKETPSNGQQIIFSTEPSNVRLTPVLPPYTYNNTIDGIQFNSQ